MKKIAGFLLLYSLALSCSNQDIQGCFPNSDLPDTIEPLTSFGQRAEWSLDGKTVYFVDKAGGEIFKVDVKTKKVKQLSDSTMRPAGHAYYRIMCLSNGDFLLSCGPGRRDTYIQIWDKGMKTPPVSLNEQINEGPAVSRQSMKIAWTEKQETIISGELSYRNGIPEIVNKKVIIYNDSVIADSIHFPKHMLEPQSFRPGKENELLWSMYGLTDEGVFTSETMLYDSNTGEIKNLSKAPGQYDEPEGIYPDGIYTLTECDHHRKTGTNSIDIYKLEIDSEGKNYTRLTFFSEIEGFRASNPVVNDEGTMIAFQASESGSEPGAGCGLYLMNIDNSEK